jgi:hypothetical protein
MLRDTNRQPPARGNPAGLRQPLAGDLEGTNIVAAGIHNKKIFTIITQRQGPLVFQSVTNPQASGGKRRCLAQIAIRALLIRDHAVTCGRVLHRINGSR